MDKNINITRIIPQTNSFPSFTAMYFKFLTHLKSFYYTTDFQYVIIEGDTITQSHVLMLLVTNR